MCSLEADTGDRRNRDDHDEQRRKYLRAAPQRPRVRLRRRLFVLELRVRAPPGREQELTRRVESGPESRPGT